MASGQNKTHIRRIKPENVARNAEWRLLGANTDRRPLNANRSPASLLARYGGTTAALALVTALMWLVREDLGLLNTVLIYEIVVVGATVFAGQRAGILAASLAFFLFDFFLVPPYLTFAIGNLQNILALFVFLGFSLLISWLIAGAREQAEQARRRAEDVAQLYDLARAIVGARSVDDVLAATTNKVADVFSAGACWLLLPNAQQQLVVRAESPADGRAITRDELSLASWAFWHSSPVGQVASGANARKDAGAAREKAPNVGQNARTVFVPLRSGAKTVGVLGIADKHNNHPFADAERIALATFGDQAAGALERLVLLKEAQRAEVLAKTDELKSALISAVSHDLRTPLASIMAMVTGLLDKSIEWDEAGQREFLEGIYDEARRLNRLVGALLDMSRIEGGALHPEMEWYSIREVISAVAQRLDQPLQQTQHPLLLDIEPNLPLTLLDYTQIDQVVSNLVENAIKYTPPGTEIKIRARQARNNIEVEVADQGLGVNVENLPHLFDKFYRVERDRRAGKQGTGLGLAIAKGLIEAHGGRIWATSQPGQGLTITFALPIQQAAPDQQLDDRQPVTDKGAATTQSI